MFGWSTNYKDKLEKDIHSFLHEKHKDFKKNNMLFLSILLEITKTKFTLLWIKLCRSVLYKHSYKWVNLGDL